jgi:hypothetical protein
MRPAPGRVTTALVFLLCQCAAHSVHAGEASGGAALNVNSVRDQHNALLSKRASLTNEVSMLSLEFRNVEILHSLSHMLHYGVFSNKALSLSRKHTHNLLCVTQC